MQNLPNINSVEGVVVGSAMLILWIAPAVLGWGDAWRRRKLLAKAAAHEAALAREARLAAEAALAREAALLIPPPASAVAVPSFADLQQLWDEPTVTVDLEDLGAPAAAPAPVAVFEVPVDAPDPAPIVAAPVLAESTLPPIPPTIEPPPTPQAIEPPATPEAAQPPHAEPVSEPPAAAEPVRFHFCLQELRRARLANWPPAEVHADPVRSAAWREAERLAAERDPEIGATPLGSPHPAQSSCFGSADSDDVAVRLHFLLFPVLWPSTAEQATAEAVFEFDRAGGAMRSQVNSLRRSS